MFYGQCWKCGERWGLGTASTCKCPDETPKREWVGLNDAEVENLCLSLGAEPIEVRFIEAKLKEKNNG